MTKEALCELALQIKTFRERAEAAEQRAGELEAKLKKFEEFVVYIRDGYDCDTGANGVHAYHCRCCVAGGLLGKPPAVFDQRTRGG